ncbi:cysteine dioxygenase [Verticiella sediminum]|uniref:Cysteine dioxygenase n=1 Tax=Verticiella sediminum TaxID=1247510 RepID=A0A556AMU3_9BURK|nr:cysteine dioxygenase family protein [Verticiella sediminum]TSH94214.1 cysteine dioxygenase [Verticiella sediminum]
MTVLDAPRSALPQIDAPGTPLGRIVADVTAACAGDPATLPATVEQALRAHAHDARILAERFRQPASHGYCRHLLHADPRGRFSMVALVWAPGQRTAVHAHYTWCAYRVLAGRLTEERYRWDAGRSRSELRETVARVAGQTGYGHAGYEQIHRLGNDDGQIAISLHVYGIDGERVATHVNRLTDPS